MNDHDTIEDIINEFAPLIRLPIPSMEHPDVRESNQRGYVLEFARRIITAHERIATGRNSELVLSPATLSNGVIERELLRGMKDGPTA